MGRAMLCNNCEIIHVFLPYSRNIEEEEKKIVILLSSLKSLKLANDL